MSENDIRSMLLDGLARLKYEILSKDSDSGENHAVRVIVKRAEGLPLYVHYILDDLLSGQFRVSELSTRLPQGIISYYDDVMTRLSLGDLSTASTAIVAALAWAKAPLDEAALLYFLVFRSVFLDEMSAKQPFKRALLMLQALLRRKKEGLELYHSRFREHVQQDTGKIMPNQNGFTKRGLSDLALKWGQLDARASIYKYILLFGPSHVAEHKQAESLRALLYDYAFVKAKVGAGMIASLVQDYAVFGKDDPILSLARALIQSARTLDKDPSQLPTQIYARLFAASGDRFEKIRAEAFRDLTYLEPLWPSLLPLAPEPGQESAGHAGWVRSVSWSPDSQYLVTAGDDRMIKI